MVYLVFIILLLLCRFRTTYGSIYFWYPILNAAVPVKKSCCFVVVVVVVAIFFLLVVASELPALVYMYYIVGKRAQVAGKIK